MGNRCEKCGGVRGEDVNTQIFRSQPSMPDGLLEVTSPPDLPHLLSLSSQDLPRCFGKVFPRSSQLSHGRCVLLPSLCLLSCLLCLPVDLLATNQAKIQP